MINQIFNHGVFNIKHSAKLDLSIRECILYIHETIQVIHEFMIVLGDFGGPAVAMTFDAEVLGSISDGTDL